MEEEIGQELIDINENKGPNEYKGYLVKIDGDNYLMLVNCEISKKMIESNKEIEVQLEKCTLSKIQLSLNKDKNIENINNLSFIKLEKDKYDDNCYLKEDDPNLDEYKENINLLKQKLHKSAVRKMSLIILASVLGLILILLYFLFFRSKKEYDSEEELVNYNLNITWPSKRKRGKGIINYLNGYRFEGNFKKGKANGDGIIYDGNGEVILEGNFTEGLLIAGILYKDECTYKGQFKNGTFDKYGECKYNHFDKKILEEDNFYIYDGIKYQGGWKNGEKSGDGIMVYEYDKNNKMKIYYTGQWENDKKNGNGKLYYGDLDYYECTWENNLKEGSGKKYKNGKLIFEGNWSNDLRSGNGISYNENGTKLYEGEWLNNKKNGKGKLYYDDGDYYDGNFVNDKRNGYGIVYSKGKIVCSGNFVEDNYQYGKSEPKKRHC